MGERKSSSWPAFVARNCLIVLFSTASIFFLLSWFVLLDSTNTTSLVPYRFTPESVPLSGLPTRNSSFSSQSNPAPSLGNRSILSDDDEHSAGEEKQAERKKSCRCHHEVEDEPLKVYMYDLDPEFHFGLLGWRRLEGESVWPEVRTVVPHYPGGLNLQHSIAYWLTLDLLFSEQPDPRGPRAAVRVRNSSDADVIFVPFFSSLSYNRLSKVRVDGKRNKNQELQEKLVRFVTRQEEWRRSGGIDHVVMAHHPNSLLSARTKLHTSIFVLSDFGRYPPRIANVDKDVIAPYKHVVPSYVNDASDFDSRTTLMFFQGAIYRKDGGFVREALFHLLKDERNVHFASGTVRNDGVRSATRGMRASKFCLNIAGDTPSSNRLFDAIASHCVPVIISDDIELPYEDVLDYSEFCVFVRTSDALRRNFLVDLLRGVTREEWTRMQRRMKEVEKFFEFRFPSRGGDAVQMIWRAVARKVPSIRRRLNRSRRFRRHGELPVQNS